MIRLILTIMLSALSFVSIGANDCATPTQAYDSRGGLVWEMLLDVYGEVMECRGDRTLVPFRYQGQYEDTETGLHYNRFLYYAPGMGMYISSDPIGIAGNNPTLYRYVEDVNIWLDLLGLYKNSNNQIGHFGIYKITINGEVYKYGKADLSRTTTAGFDGRQQPTRLHQQVRKLRELYPTKVISGKVINDLGEVTTTQAKLVETQTIQAHYERTNTVPVGNQRSFRPSCR
ncbi:RHS repeat domain-containing protein [Parabacteroides goldsteinii]|uniref:RHS repeat domain-containing protein n=1 Tax=Parabacteroides goldsteinii TaxID=328812 RepID=UPI003AF14932